MAIRWTQNIMKARKKRQNVTAFGGLLATPATGSFVLPASARLAFRSVSGCAADTTIATLTGATVRTIKSITLAAGEHQVLDHAEQGVTVAAEADFEVLVDVGLGKFLKVAEGA